MLKALKAIRVRSCLLTFMGQKTRPDPIHSKLFFEVIVASFFIQLFALVTPLFFPSNWGQALSFDFYGAKNKI